jgi:hypothetical protein
VWQAVGVIADRAGHPRQWEFPDSRPVTGKEQWACADRDVVRKNNSALRISTIWAIGSDVRSTLRIGMSVANYKIGLNSGIF